MKVIGNKLFQLMPKDFIKGLIMSTITAVLTLIYDMINAGTFPTDSQSWMSIGRYAAIVMLGYILKNFTTNSQDKWMKAEPKA